MSNGRPYFLIVCKSLRPRALPISPPTLRYPRSFLLDRRYFSRRPFNSTRSTPLRAHGHLSQISPAFPRACRRFSTTPVAAHGHTTPPKPGEELHVTFVDKDGSEHTFEVSAGDNLMDIAQAEGLEMEGACGGSCACSTCHVIVDDPTQFDAMPEPSYDEEDMLDLAFALTATSRLGCQVKMSKEIDGLKVRLPSKTRNLQAADFKGAKKS